MTQEYTPVAWQDETTSQQGTLINAERLNQMQQAHHFADGLEEVDAVPTADPGVAYHKIVYCTADSTIYRWDGTAWTADIDDETKRLLLEHEADHGNPHAVTKAQVGLGNADNTADADKPISTAAQTALDAKADKATTYTKSETDTLLASKADKADTYDKTAVDGLLAGKVDKLISSPAGTYKSVTVNAQGQVTAGTNPTTLAGYGITDAYTKAEAQTYVSNALDNYAPMVRTSGNQTIAGVKTYTGRQILSYTNLELYNSALYVQSQGYDLTAPPSYATRTLMQFYTGANLDQVASRDECSMATGGNSRGIIVHSRSTEGADQTATFTITSFRDGTACMRGPSRAYSAGNTTDVATIGTLDAYTPMVRTTGNQDISGRKTYTEQVVFKKNQYPLYHTIVDDVSSTGVTSANASGLQFYGASGLYLGRDCLVYHESNKYATHDLRINSIINSGTHARLYIEEKADGTFALSFWNGQAWTRLVQ